jgi:hypothetical protein
MENLVYCALKKQLLNVNLYMYGEDVKGVESFNVRMLSTPLFSGETGTHPFMLRGHETMNPMPRLFVGGTLNLSPCPNRFFSAIGEMIENGHGHCEKG